MRCTWSPRPAAPGPDSSQPRPDGYGGNLRSPPEPVVRAEHRRPLDDSAPEALGAEGLPGGGREWAVPYRSPSQEPDSVTLGNRPRTGCDTMQVQVIDGAGGAVAEMARNIRYGTVRSVLPYLLQDDYSRELVPQETSVATLENDYLLATVLLDLVAGSGRFRTRLAVVSCCTTTTGYSSAISGCEMPGSRAESSGTWEPQGIRH